MAIARRVAPLCFAFVLVVSPLFAERPIALNELQPRGGGASETRDFRPQEEKAALQFVKEHHAELASLLISLKERNESQYRAAIRDLNRTRVRLDQLRSRSEERHKIELNAWKIKSRIQLLTARLQMNDTPEIRKELFVALKEQTQLRLETLELERERLAERLQKIEEQISNQGDAEATAEQQLKLLLNRVKATNRPKPKPAKPSPKQ